MKRMIVMAIVIVGGVAVWRLGSRLSADAVGMAVGILLGVLASIPASLLMLASSRRRDVQESERWPEPPRERLAPAHQPPVIVLAGQAPPQQQLAPSPYPSPHAVYGWPQPSTSARQFKIVGEQEQWLE